MRATKREGGLLVTKVGETPDRLPARLGMAALAAQFEVTVRASGRSALLSPRTQSGGRKGGQDAAEDDWRDSSVPHGSLFMFPAGIGNGEYVLRDYFHLRRKATDLKDRFRTDQVPVPLDCTLDVLRQKIPK